jgi:hypothetical protein
VFHFVVARGNIKAFGELGYEVNLGFSVEVRALNGTSRSALGLVDASWAIRALVPGWRIRHNLDIKRLEV